MRITVLGCGAAFPRPGGACSGFLVEGGGATVWVDAGNGTFSRLEQVSSWRVVDALVVTHAHADHVSDMLPLMYAMCFDRPPRHGLPVYASPEVPARLSAFLGPTSNELFWQAFDFRPLHGAFEIGNLRIEPFPVNHPVDTHGIRLVEDGKTAVYTSDTAYFSGLIQACRGAGILLCEATYVDGVEAEGGVHMWAREAGRLAAEAGVDRLLLTHIWATVEVARAEAEARESFAGPVEAAAEGRTYAL